MTIAITARQSFPYIGRFVIDGDEMPFVYDGAKTRKEVTRMGDVVYFMYVDEDLMKIGKAGGKGGFPGRANTYKLGMKGDATNRRIITLMKQMGKTEIEVHATSVPRSINKTLCQFTRKELLFETPMHGAVETHYTTLYLNESSTNTLPFCHQLK